MIEKIIAGLSGFIIATISTLGYGGVALLMAIESACIPLPSEVIARMRAHRWDRTPTDWSM